MYGLFGRGLWEVCRFARGDFQGHAVFGAEGDGGLEGDGRIGERCDRVLLGKGGQQQYGFGPCEGFADALAGAATEGEIGVTGMVGLVGPALREKFFGVGPKARIAMGDPLAHQNGGFGAEGIGAQVEGLQRLAADGPGGRVKAHGFGNDHAGEGKAVDIVRAWRDLAEGGVEFGVQLLLNIGMFGQKIPGEGQGVGGGFVAGGEEGVAFGKQLRIVHGAAVLFGVVGVKENRKEVAAIVVRAGRSAALLDDIADGIH